MRGLSVNSAGISSTGNGRSIRSEFEREQRRHPELRASRFVQPNLNNVGIESLSLDTCIAGSATTLRWSGHR